MKTISKRIRRIFQHADDTLEAILILNATEPFIDANFFYVTGLEKGLYERCIALIYPDGTGEMLITKLESESAMKSLLKQTIYETNTDFHTELHQMLSAVTHVGIHGSAMSYRDYLMLKEQLPHTNFQDVTDTLNIVRMRKDEEEIRIIQTACNIAVKTMQQIPDFIEKGMSEDDLAAEIDYHLIKHGADASAFDTISSFGDHTALPHYTHGHRTLKEGDFILCDFGARFKRYHSDITRTFVYGDASAKQHRIHDIVREAQKQAIAAIKPGVEASQIHLITQRFIDESEFTGSFIHSTGHSLGLSVHDVGIGLHAQSHMPLESRMILTVEPGIYLPCYGGVRIEDDICITDDGCIELTELSRELIEI